jgi:alpha-beta hydrolase superfamily lysophospholipase
VPDARVQAAIDNWAPRFVTNGVDFNDFRRTTAGIERWDDWLDAWVATGDAHAALATEAESELSAGEAWVHAALAYHFAKFVWVLDMERNHETTRRAIAALERAHACLDPAAERVEIPFDGVSLAANLRRPEGPLVGPGMRGRRARPGARFTRGGEAPEGVEDPPLVLLIPGLDSTKEEFFHWENVFLQRGLATLSLDGPGQGESGFDLHIRPDYEVAVSATLDAVDWRGPVGAAGVSLGGYYAPRAAAREPRVRAVAGVSGAFNFGECWDGLPGLTRETFQHHSGATDEEEARAKAHELDLAPVIEDLEQPALMVTGRRDRIIPWEQTERIARKAPNGTFVVYEEANHVCNDVPYKYRPLVADWLRKELERVG